MLAMRLPILRVLCRHSGIPDDHEILRILVLRRVGEVEAARDDGLTIDDDDLIMCNLCAMAWLASIIVGTPWLARKSAEEYFSVH